MPTEYFVVTLATMLTHGFRSLSKTFSVIEPETCGGAIAWQWLGALFGIVVFLIVMESRMEECLQPGFLVVHLNW